MSDHNRGAAAAAGFGVGFLLAGTALLLQEFNLLTVRWSFVLPLIVIAAGVAVVFSGLMGAHRSRRSAPGPQLRAVHQDMTGDLPGSAVVAPFDPTNVETAPTPLEKQS